MKSYSETGRHPAVKKWHGCQDVNLPSLHDIVALQEKIGRSFRFIADLESVLFNCLALASLIESQATPGRPFVLGINGAQGSGKSTFAKVLKAALQLRYGLETFILSIDDLYLSRSRRKQLSQDIHPLFITRGVPGTHDVARGITILNELARGNEVPVPRFNKALDDDSPENTWQTVSAVDVVLFEGWCVGARPQRAADLDIPVNALEKTEDAEGVWRHYVNDCLSKTYQELFSFIDMQIMLKVPGMQQVIEWRRQQEHELIAANGQGMDDQALDRFIMHFERLTRHQLHDMPGCSDVVFELDIKHAVKNITSNLPVARSR